MKPTVYALLQLVTTMIRSRLSLQLEVVALRHQLSVYQRTAKRPQLWRPSTLVVAIAPVAEVA